LQFFGKPDDERLATLVARDAAVPVDELEPALDGLADDVVRRADLRELVADLARLPEDQRGALKALVFQARTALIAEREARETPCEEIRGQLAVGRAGALRRGPLRRHLRHCEPCTAYRLAVASQRARLALILPVAPSVGLKAAVLGSSGGGARAHPYSDALNHNVHTRRLKRGSVAATGARERP
jgi:hypothetical protein